MAKLSVPPLDPALHSLMVPVAQNQRLDDDALWQSKVLPLVISRLNTLDHSVRQALTTNAHTPGANTVDRIHRTLAATVSKLNGHFCAAAPFTVARLAELLVNYTESGYSLATVALAHKYVDAVARTLSVSSTETNFAQHAVAAAEEPSPSGLVSMEEYQRHGLPTNVVYKPLKWAPKKQKTAPVDLHSSPIRHRPETEAEDPCQAETRAADSETGSKRQESPKRERNPKRNTKVKHERANALEGSAAASDASADASAPNTSTTGTAGPEPETETETTQTDSRKSKRGAELPEHPERRRTRKSARKLEAEGVTRPEGCYENVPIDCSGHPNEHRNEEVLI